MKITKFALRRPVTTLMFFLCFVIAGGTATKFLPLEFFPEVVFPGIFIQIPYPNSTAEEVERLITRPVEEVLSTMSGIESLRSTSSDDNAQIQVFFDWSAQAKIKGVEAREKIDAIRAELPDDLRRVMVFTGSTNDAPVMQLRISSSKDLQHAFELLDRKLKRPIELLEGVSTVTLYGIQKSEILIQLKSERIAAHRIDINALNATLQKHNFSSFAGRINDGEKRLRVKPLGEFESIDDYKNLIVGPNNLRLKDIANISLSQPILEDGRHLDRTYAIGIMIQREGSSNLVDVASRVVDKITEIEESPDFDGITLFVMDNQAEGITSSIRDITTSGLIGFCLSILVLFFFLRNVAITMIVAMAVPFSLCITLAAMYLLGISLNVLSMMGLMLAIGMLVDNAVVITESIYQQKKLTPDDPEGSTIRGVQEVGVAVTAGTITTAIVFLPNIIGEKIDITVFLSHVAVAITISLAASLFIATTIIPLMLNKIRTASEPKPVKSIEWLTKVYASSLGWLLQRPKIAAFIALCIIGSLGIATNLVKSDMFPEEQRTNLLLHYNIDSTYTIEAVENTVFLIEDFLYEHQEELDILSVYSYYQASLAQSTIIFIDKDKRTKSNKEVREFVEENLPKIAMGKPSFERNRGGGQEGISVQLVGDSTERLVAISEEVIRIINNIDGLQDAKSGAGVGEKEIQVKIDRDKAQNLGLTPDSIARTIGIAMRGQNLRTFRTEEGEVEVKIVFDNSNRKSLSDLHNLPVFRPGQDSLPLAAMADFSVHNGPQVIRREAKTTLLTVSANLSDDADMDKVKEELKRVMDNMEFPTAYYWKFGRGLERDNKVGTIMMTNMGLAIMMIFIVMAALFESLLLPIAVISSIVFSVVGVFWFFFITGTTMSFMGMIGILVLMGVVVNNGIVLIDHINRLREKGLRRYDAIIQGGTDRLRPILMTVATTILGLVPLAVGDATIGGGGAPAYFPMARAIIGGLLFSTIVSLLILPSIYIGLDSLRVWGRAKLKIAISNAGHLVNNLKKVKSS
ncbi:MAG: acriflavin resistance protein [Gammaproteobacteria bacterium]|nr:MAG: acriflavin resistance protein [Gammaproteobacteria bacterium]